jgi:hypothetical protein
MAVISISEQSRSEPWAFPAIWEHYLASGFLYHSKLARLQPVMPDIIAGWPKLLAAPPELFQLHLASSEDAIISSVCAFRDSQETYVVQHASSMHRPDAMLNCLRSCWRAISADPDFHHARMFFRAENRWPARLVRTIALTMPAHLTALVEQEYLTCRPAIANRIPMPVGAYEVTVAEEAQVEHLATAALGGLWARAAGLGVHSLSLDPLRARYAASDLVRSRKVLGARRDGALAGVAFCHRMNVPANFSLLCSRVEIVIHPGAPDRENVVAELARAAVCEAALTQAPASALLVDPVDAAAATAAGYARTGKRYSNFIWSREHAHGAPSVFKALDTLYASLARYTDSTAARAPAQSDRTQGDGVRVPLPAGRRTTRGPGEVAHLSRARHP